MEDQAKETGQTLPNQPANWREEQMENWMNLTLASRAVDLGRTEIQNSMVRKGIRALQQGKSTVDPEDGGDEDMRINIGDVVNNYYSEQPEQPPAPKYEEPMSMAKVAAGAILAFALSSAGGFALSQYFQDKTPPPNYTDTDTDTNMAVEGGTPVNPGESK